MYTDEQIIKEIQKVASKLNKKSLSIADFKKYGNISDGTSLIVSVLGMRLSRKLV